MTNGERLEMLEASHVRLMTEHELEVRKSDKAWKRHRRWLREYEAQRKADDERWTAYREEQKARDVALDARIAELASGIGAFIAAQKTK